MNSLFNMLGGMSNMTGNTNILLQAVGAALRGESPQQFMKRLANQHPQLKRMNLEDLQGSAQQLCKERGLNPDDVAKDVDNVIAPMLPK